MKKFFIGTAAAVLVALVCIWAVIDANQPETAEEPAIQTEAAVTEETETVEAAAVEDTAVEEAESVALRTVDLDALYGALAPEDVVATVDGEDITWEDYYGWLDYNVRYIQNYMEQYYSYYGAAMDWEDDSGYEDMTLIDYVKTMSEDYLKQYIAINRLAKEMKVELDSQTVENSLLETAVTYCGTEDATLEDLEAYLQTVGITMEQFRKMLESNQLYNQCYVEKYGEFGEKAEESEVLTWLEESGYLYANHILLSTMDTSTYTELDEETVAEKLQQAEELAKELQAIKDPEKLLARFAELKEQYCEDGGKETYANGYAFVEGDMVTEFYEGALALSEYQVSDPVKSDYGYHIIIRLPLSGEMDLSDDGSGTTARETYAKETFGNTLTERVQALELISSEKLEALKLKNYIIDE